MDQLDNEIHDDWYSTNIDETTVYNTPANGKLFYSEETSLTHHIDIHMVGKIYCSLRDFDVYISVFLLLTKFTIFFVL